MMPAHADAERMALRRLCYGVTTDRWIVRDNLIRGIRCQDNTLAGPSVLLWQGAIDTIVERNTILDSPCGIALGLIPSYPGQW